MLITGRIKSLIIICAALLSSAPAYASQCEWVEGKGEVVAENFSPAEAKTLALRQARYQAIEKIVGVQVAGATLVKDFSFVGEFVRSMSRGYIQEEKLIKWEQDKYQPTEKDFPIPILRVIIEACVKPSQQLQDTGFRVSAGINKSVFNEGEKAELEISSTRRAYVNIFNLAADDRIVYYHQPPQLVMPIVVEAGGKATYPPKGVSLEMSIPAGYKKATEAFIIIATSNNANLPFIFKGRNELSLTEFYRGLLAIEGDMVEDMVIYTVEKKQ